MYTKYIIECYNPIKNRYEELCIYNLLEMAEKMFNKPYYKNITRRLVKVSHEILYTEKGKK